MVDVTADVATPIRIEGAWDDPEAIRALVQSHEPYPSIASYLPPSATRTAPGEAEGEETLPWFRANWHLRAVRAVARRGGGLGVLVLRRRRPSP